MHESGLWRGRTAPQSSLPCPPAHLRRRQHRVQPQPVLARPQVGGRQQRGRQLLGARRGRARRERTLERGLQPEQRRARCGVALFFLLPLGAAVRSLLRRGSLPCAADANDAADRGAAERRRDCRSRRAAEAPLLLVRRLPAAVIAAAPAPARRGRAQCARRRARRARERCQRLQAHRHLARPEPAVACRRGERLRGGREPRRRRVDAKIGGELRGAVQRAREAERLEAGQLPPARFEKRRRPAALREQRRAAPRAAVALRQRAQQRRQAGRDAGQLARPHLALLACERAQARGEPGRARRRTEAAERRQQRGKRVAAEAALAEARRGGGHQVAQPAGAGVEPEARQRPSQVGELVGRQRAQLRPQQLGARRPLRGGGG
jgi:hypothetical protein